ncbi:unnamed protein product, partial [Ectocarpus sp. 12 AP-2014]
PRTVVDCRGLPLVLDGLLGSLCRAAGETSSGQEVLRERFSLLGRDPPAPAVSPPRSRPRLSTSLHRSRHRGTLQESKDLGLERQVVHAGALLVENGPSLRLRTLYPASKCNSGSSCINTS